MKPFFDRLRRHVRALRLRITWPDLGQRIILLTCLINFLVFILVSFTFYASQSRAANRNLVMERSNLCAEANSIAENACAYIRGVADNYSANDHIDYILQHNDPESSELAADMFSFFQPDNYVLSVILYNPSGAPVQYMTIDASHSPLPQGENAIFQSLISRRQNYVWEYVDGKTPYLFRQDNSPKLCLWRVIKSRSNTTVLGALAITIDVRKLLNYEVSYTSDYRRNFLIYDRNSEQIIFNRTKLEFSDSEMRTLQAELLRQEDGYLEMDTDDGERQVYFRSISDTPLMTLYIPAVTQGSNLPALWTNIMAAMLVFVLSMIPLLIYITRRLTLPLERLKSKFQQFSQGDFSASIPNASNDTIGRVEQAFNSMVVENRRLIERTYVAELKAKESELILLQAQINPHFIYNLINTIHWSALRNHEEDIANIAYSMGQLLHISLNRDCMNIPVSRECELIQCYVGLQKHRYGTKLEYSLECDPAAQEILIPKLIIQPLVENAIVHGMENIITTLHVQTTINLEDGALVIEVEDDGAGIPPEILEQLPNRYRRDERRSGNGLALYNIYERLVLLYGADAFEFTIGSELNCGTFVTLRLPLFLPTP